MKKLYFLLALLFPAAGFAQIPPGYYNGILGQNGAALQNALHNKIKDHTALTYTPGLWNAYYTTDKKPGTNKLWTIYSDKPGQASPYEFTMGSDQCSGSSPNNEDGCYNREHTWPQSKFSSAAPMQTDLWIVYPTDYYVNSQRADWPYGKVNAPSKTFQNGSKLGPNVYGGAPSGTAFEPIDSFKGDIARTYFYIVTRYLGEDGTWNDWEMANKAVLKPWAVQMLLEWHHLDPVSNKEVLRNDAAYPLQNNRNPFIDYPQFADCIWGEADCTPLSITGSRSLLAGISIYPNPAVNEVYVDWQRLSPDEVLAVDVLNLQGQVLYHKDRPAEHRLKISVDAWPKGMYVLKVHGKDATAAQKLVVE